MQSVGQSQNPTSALTHPGGNNIMPNGTYTRASRPGVTFFAEPGSDSSDSSQEAAANMNTNGSNGNINGVGADAPANPKQTTRLSFCKCKGLVRVVLFLIVGAAGVAFQVKWASGQEESKDCGNKAGETGRVKNLVSRYENNGPDQDLTLLKRGKKPKESAKPKERAGALPPKRVPEPKTKIGTSQSERLAPQGASLASRRAMFEMGSGKKTLTSHIPSRVREVEERDQAEVRRMAHEAKLRQEEEQKEQKELEEKQRQREKREKAEVNRKAEEEKRKLRETEERRKQERKEKGRQRTTLATATVNAKPLLDCNPTSGPKPIAEGSKCVGLEKSNLNTKVDAWELVRACGGARIEAIVRNFVRQSKDLWPASCQSVVCAQRELLLEGKCLVSVGDGNFYCPFTDVMKVVKSNKTSKSVALQLIGFLFELMNFLQRERFTALHKDLQLCHIGPGAFGEAKAEVEFDGTGVFIKLLDQLVSQVGNEWEDAFKKEFDTELTNQRSLWARGFDKWKATAHNPGNVRLAKSTLQLYVEGGLAQIRPDLKHMRQNTKMLLTATEVVSCFLPSTKLSDSVNRALKKYPDSSLESQAEQKTKAFKELEQWLLGHSVVKSDPEKTQKVKDFFKLPANMIPSSGARAMFFSVDNRNLQAQGKPKCGLFQDGRPIY